MKYMNRCIMLSGVVAVFLSLAAYALDLDSARKTGVVGERSDGYVDVVGTPSPEVQALVNDINQKRRGKYEEVSKSTGQPVDVVAVLAYKKILERLQPGEYFMDAQGNWVVKK